MAKTDRHATPKPGVTVPEAAPAAQAPEATTPSPAPAGATNGGQTIMTPAQSLTAAPSQPNATPAPAPIASPTPVALTLPVGKRSGYIQRTLDFTLTPAESGALADLAAGLTASGETIGAGKKVRNSADSVRWIAQQLIKAAATANAPTPTPTPASVASAVAISTAKLQRP